MTSSAGLGNYGHVPTWRDYSHEDGPNGRRGVGMTTPRVLSTSEPNGGGGRGVSMTSPAAAGLGPDGPASHLPGRHSSDSGSFKLIKNLLVTAHWDGRSPQRRNRSFVPRKRSGGEHRFYYPKRKAPPKSAFGVSFLRCDVTFSTPHHITHRKPKTPSIRKNRACPYVSLGSP